QVAAPCWEWMRQAAPGLTPPQTTQSALPGCPGEAEGGQGPGQTAQDGAASLVGAEGSGGGARSVEYKALEDEFEKFMQGLMSESALLEPPGLELDEHELYGGTDDGAGSRDQGAAAAGAAVAVSAGVAPFARDAAAAATAPRPGDSRIGTAASQAAPTAVPQVAAAPPPPPLPGLQRLLSETATSAHLTRAVRSGDAEAVLQARCLTTALLVAGPGAAAEWLLLRPAALHDLLAGLFRCFAFDRNAATLILHLRGEAGAYAPVVAEAVAPVAPVGPASATTASESAPSAALGNVGKSAGTAAAAAATAMAGGTAAAAELPRMPLGLLYLASQRSYAAVAAVARTMGRLARAADVSTATTSSSSGVALWRLVDELVSGLRLASRGGGDASASGLATGGSCGGQVLEGSDSEGEGAGEAGASVRPAAAAAVATMGGPSWQCEAAAVVAIIAEVVIGASNAWAPPLEPEATTPSPSGPPQPSSLSSQQPSTASAVTSAFPATDSAFESLLLTLLDELMRPRIIKLCTHNNASSTTDDISAAASSSHNAAPATSPAPLSYDDVVHPELTVVRQRPLSAQALGENVMLLRVVLEAVGTAARAVGRRFTSPGRLLRRVLVPLLELLGDPAPPVAAAADTALQS
ncbi:hypothetical protein Agub_g109, partial [Astrephomene gubernaculifera]